MPASLPAQRLPFTTFPGIPQEAGRRIWRDFEELIRTLPSSPTIFDAIIDSQLTASDSTNHRYKNLGDLLASETLVVGTRFNVGVKQGATAIDDSAGVGTHGVASGCILGLWGIQPGMSQASSSVPAWNWQPCTLGGSTLILSGLHIGGTGVSAQGTIIGYQSHFASTVTGVGASGVSGGTYVEYTECVFDGNISASGSIAVGQTANFYNCIFNANLDLGAGNNLTRCQVYGGKIVGNLTTWGTTGTSCYISVDECGAATLGATGVFHATNGASVNVTTSQNMHVTGNFSTLTMAAAQYTNIGGSPFTANHTFKGTTSGTCDFTGPGRLDTITGVPFSGNQVILRGDNVHADIMAFEFTIPAVNCIGLKHSQIRLTLEDQGDGTKPYAFDAASHNNILIMAGGAECQFKTGTFITPGTDAGTKNRVITEITDSYILSPPAGGIPSNMLPAEIAAIQSGVRVIGGPTPGDVYGPAFLLMGG